MRLFTRGYQVVPDGSSEKYSPNRKSQTKSNLGTIGVSIIAFLELVVFVGLMLAIPKPSTTPTTSENLTPEKHSCGNTREEAIAHGCTFDFLTAQWLPTSCSRSWNHEFADVDGVGFYPERTSDDMVDLSTLPIGSPYWTTGRHHAVHCIYMFLRLGEAFEGNRIDEIATNVHHQTHCAEILINATLLWQHSWGLNSAGNVVTGTC